MPKTIKLESHLSSEELENRYRKAHDPVLRSHYQILWLISEGKSTTQVMEVTGYSRGWIQQLARRYNEGGPEALGDRRHGNPGARDRALLSAEQQEELKEALLRSPRRTEGCGTLGRWASGSSAGVAKRSAARSRAAGST
jgi:hypothetical protein